MESKDVNLKTVQRTRYFLIMKKIPTYLYFWLGRFKDETKVRTVSQTPSGLET